MAFRLDRRAVLRGLGGAMLPLPALEVMAPRNAHAAKPPQRFILCYGGCSIGAFYTPPWDQIVPRRTGPDYDITRGLKGIEEFQVKGDVGIVSGLKIPWGPNNAIPPAGRDGAFSHFSTKVPQTTGLASSNNVQEAEIPRGPSADQLVSQAISGGSPTLAYRVQPISYYGQGSIGVGASLSWRQLPTGKMEPIQPVASPRQAYQSLFGEAETSPSGGGPDLLLARRKSIVDLVKTNASRLLERLGREDRMKLQGHLDEVRSLETRIDQLGKLACMRPSAPGADPPIGVTDYINGCDSHCFIPGEDTGWSNEELRAQVLCDLIRMAFACDLGRVATLQFTIDQSLLNMYHIDGIKSDVHSLGHGGTPGADAATIEGMADAVGWHVKHFARLASKLRESAAGDGTTLLDNTAMVMVFECGHGRDGGDGDDGSFTAYKAGNHSSHSGENMVAIIGGHAGGLKCGQHIQFNYNDRFPPPPSSIPLLSPMDRHPAQVVLTMMKAVGANMPLGDINKPIDELFK